MKTQIHVLLKEDKKLFDDMVDNYLSSQERDFLRSCVINKNLARL